MSSENALKLKGPGRQSWEQVCELGGQRWDLPCDPQRARHHRHFLPSPSGVWPWRDEVLSRSPVVPAWVLPQGPPSLLSDPPSPQTPAGPSQSLSLTVVLGLSSKKAQRPLRSLLVLKVQGLGLPLPRGLEEAGTDAICTALVGIGHLQDPGGGQGRSCLRSGVSGVRHPAPAL